jgi:tetratricopeptide (TPR) repeat protein
VALERSTLDSAIDTLERELLDGRGSRAYAPLTEAYRREGRLDDAIRVGRAGAQAYPGHVGIRIVLARALAESSQAQDAREEYEEVLRLDPSSSEARIALGLLGRRPTAAPPPATNQKPSGPAGLSEELAHLSDLFCPRPDTDLAGRGCEFSGIATLTLAEIYARQGFPQRAVEVCELILERRPDDSTARTRLEEYRRSLAAL